VELAFLSYRTAEGLLSRRDDSEHVGRCGVDVNLHPFLSCHVILHLGNSDLRREMIVQLRVSFERFQIAHLQLHQKSIYLSLLLLFMLVSRVNIYRNGVFALWREDSCRQLSETHSTVSAVFLTP
jgi:hypothetical protein